MSPRSDTSAVELEISLGWADANPDLFLSSVSKFHADHPADVWERKVDPSRGGFLFLRADRWPALDEDDITELRERAAAYLSEDKPWRKAALQAVLTDLGLSRVNEAKTRAQRMALEDLMGVPE